mgnify:CR=1 FL=1
MDEDTTRIRAGATKRIEAELSDCGYVKDATCQILPGEYVSLWFSAYDRRCPILLMLELGEAGCMVYRPIIEGRSLDRGLLAIRRCAEISD